MARKTAKRTASLVQQFEDRKKEYEAGVTALLTALDSVPEKDRMGTLAKFTEFLHDKGKSYGLYHDGY